MKTYTHRAFALDTRRYVRVGERWLAVPGSGRVEGCDECGEKHEVFLVIEPLPGPRGTRNLDTERFCSKCAGRNLFGHPHRTAVVAQLFRVAKTLARLHAELEVLRTEKEEFRRVAAEVAELPFPGVRTTLRGPEGDEVPERANGLVAVHECGHVRVVDLSESEHPLEHLEPALRHLWEESEFRKRGVTRSRHAIEEDTRTVETEWAKQWAERLVRL